MTFVDVIPLVVVGAFALSAVMQRVVSRSAQKARLIMAQKGEALLARTDVHPALRADVERMLDDPFPCNCYLLILMLPILPVLVWYSLSSTKSGERFDALREASREVRGCYLELRALGRKVELANHPIMAPLAEFVVSLSVVLAVPVLVMTHQATDAALDRDNATATVDEFWAHLPKLARQ